MEHIHKQTLWWGYVDNEGVIRIKRYVNDRQIENCERSPFCKGIFDPFLAWNQADAKAKILAFLHEEQTEWMKKQNENK